MHSRSQECEGNMNAWREKIRMYQGNDRLEHSFWGVARDFFPAWRFLYLLKCLSPKPQFIITLNAMFLPIEPPSHFELQLYERHCLNYLSRVSRITLESLMSLLIFPSHSNQWKYPAEKCNLDLFYPQWQKRKFRKFHETNFDPHVDIKKFMITP